MSQLYARVFLKILDSSIAEDFMLRHVFEDFLKLADSGVVDMTREALSRRLNIPQTIINENIAKLEAADPNSRDEDFEGRRIERLDDYRDWGWRILNWEKYEEIKTRADVAVRVARHRQAKREKQTVESTPLSQPGLVNAVGSNHKKENGSTWNPSPDQIRLAALFKRRPTTKWDDKEIKAFKRLGPIDPEDWVLLERYYSARHPPDKDYRRRDLQTLLNNFSGEIDRARNFKEPKLW